LKNNLYRHIKHFCKGEVNYETLKKQNDKICLLEKEIEILKSKNETIQHIGVQNNIQNIYINAFGKENKEYITKEYVQNLVKDGPYACIQKLIKYIHFNPNHTENQNIRIPNKRDKFGQIFNGEKWVLENKIDMITTITENAFDIITEHCDDLNSKKYDKFCNEFENREKNCIKRISGDTELLILNYQEE
jgi:16S rRNA G966 N2-methylase RsmD